MATAIAQRRDTRVKEYTYLWEGIDRNNRSVRGEIKAASETVARGHRNPRFARLMMDIKGRVEAGSSLSQAFREHPAQFDSLYCNLVNAGETAGMLDGILERL